MSISFSSPKLFSKKLLSYLNKKRDPVETWKGSQVVVETRG